jgi:transcriptional regulator with XRE-family HTH domain
MASLRSPALTARERFASNLKRLRQIHRISQEELADRAGLHRTYVGSVERGERNISIDNMERLAIALNLDVADLLKAVRRR